MCGEPIPSTIINNTRGETSHSGPAPQSEGRIALTNAPERGSRHGTASQSEEIAALTYAPELDVRPGPRGLFMSPFPAKQSSGQKF